MDLNQLSNIEGDEKIPRRTFNKKIVLAGAAGVATSIGGVLLHYLPGREEREDRHTHEKTQLFERLLEESADFRRDPERWWVNSRESLRVPNNARHVARCIDEGVDLWHVPHLQMNDAIDAVSLPGSGITLDAKLPTTNEEYQLIVADMRGHARGTCNHKGCAACAGIGARDEGEGFAQKLAADVEAEYFGKVEELTRPEWHSALASVLRYERTHRNPFPHAPGAPCAFDTSMWVFQGDRHRRQRVKLAGLPIEIAFGNHGNGSLFTQEHKFLVPYTYNPDSRAHSKASIEEEILEAASMQGKGHLVQPIPLATT